MQYFNCDYMEGAHPAILARLAETNMDKTEGYGYDPYCDHAKELIREACECPEAEVHFLVGGTQTNEAVISAFLRSYEGVIAPVTGHVNCHESGAIEHTGHKVLAIQDENGKLTAESIRHYCWLYEKDMSWEHIVSPGMVYISQPTEYGTLYSKAELEAIRAACDEYHLSLFVDGARLGYALASPENDVTLADLAKLTDVFYIGGTKVGALFGEAVVFPKPGICPRFFSHCKQRGAILAKGRILGIQFETLFTDDLYMKISQNAIDTAMKIRDGLKEKGYPFYNDSPTNQQFIIMSNEQADRLSGDISIEMIDTVDEDHIIVRFCTSWATRMEDVDALLALL